MKWMNWEYPSFPLHSQGPDALACVCLCVFVGGGVCGDSIGSYYVTKITNKKSDYA